MPKHAWEDAEEWDRGLPCRTSARHNWETPVSASPYAAQAGVDTDKSSEAEPAGHDNNNDAATVCFCNLLLENYLDSGISTETVCTLADYSSKAGTKGFVEMEAMKPHEGGGNFQRHPKKVLGVTCANS